MSGTGGKTVKVALIQNCAAREMEPSLAEAEALARAAVKDGADLIMATEMVEMFEPDPAAVLRKALPEDKDPGLARFRDLARETGKWIMAGSMLIREPRSEEQTAELQSLMRISYAVFCLK